MEDLKKIISKASVERVPVDNGTDEDGKPIASKKKSNMWRVDLTESHSTTIDVEADSEDDARAKALESMSARANLEK